MQNPSVKFLSSCSGTSLGEFELQRRNAAANFRKQIRNITDEWIQAESDAILARWVMENGEDLLAERQKKVPQQSFDFPAAAQAERAALPPGHITAGPKKISSSGRKKYKETIA